MMLKIALIILIVIVVLIAITFAIYWFNLDMKLVRKVYELLGKHYDTMERDRKL